MQSTIIAIAAFLSTVTATPVALAKRAEPSACINQVGNGPQVADDTVAGFYAAFPAAAASPPTFYDVAEGWVGLQAGANAPGYLTYIQDQLTSYDADVCADYCANKISGCASFVIYYERDAQSVNPNTHTPDAALGCPGLTTSPSVTLVKCSFYSAFLDVSQATEKGQYQGDFQVVIAGSTAFNLIAPTVSGYDVPTFLNDSALDIPPPVVASGYITVDTFADTYSVSSCIARCNSLVGEDGSACSAFDAYFLYTNGADAQNYGPEYATNFGQYDAAGNHYTIGDSYVYYVSSSGTKVA